MTDKEVLYIKAVAQYCSITKAAEQLYIAQPSLTQALHRIEKDYGASLFYRGRNGLQLTEAGKTYLESAAEIEQLYKNMRYEISGISGVLRGSIHIGTTMFQGGLLLPELLLRYRKKYPEVELKLMETSSAQLEELISAGKLDLGIMHRPFRNHNLSYLSLFREEFYLAVSQNDTDYLALSGKNIPLPVMTAEILRQKPLIMLTANQRVRQIADNICSAADVSPQIIFSTSSLETALSMASKGLGTAFVPASFSRYFGRFPLSFFRFPADWNANWELVIAYSKNAVLSRPCLELYKASQDCIASMPEVFQ